MVRGLLYKPRMHSPSHTLELVRQRRRQRQSLAPQVQMQPLMPRWYERGLACAVAGAALLSIVAAAISAA